MHRPVIVCAGAALAIPVFKRLKELPGQEPRRPRSRSYFPRIPDSIVAAIRWDYEQELMPLADLVRKYGEHASPSTVRAIAWGERRKGIAAVKGEA